MTESQAIVREPTNAAIFLVLLIAPGREDDVRDGLADVGGLRRSVGFRVPEAELGCVVGIGSDAWDRLYPGRPRPASLHRLPAFDGPVHAAPSTPGDILFHIRAQRMDMCFELAQRLTEHLGDAATVIDEVHGFRSFDERDLLGFVDGTENPEGDGAVEAVTVSAEQDPGFAGSSYAVVQKYLHDLTAWDALSVAEQERVMGRTKLSDIEMSDEVKPPDSHIALNVIEDEHGDERDIVRFNMPFGAVGTREFGTYFIGYVNDPAVIEQMLRNMFFGTDDAAHDRILDFSVAITGNLFVVPTVDWLEDPPAAAGENAQARAGGGEAADGSAPADGSLGVGSLRP
ncbi:MAG TPA: Dyp-type peroxidase [Solirubrobacteraceae bacterium]|nr:Dyp-type peroxidase [Solirubrobacteraceae bacterium]